MDAINTPAVQSALESARQQANAEVERKAHVTFGAIFPKVVTEEEISRAISDLIRFARKAGALDHICAEHGITEAVMARMND